MSNYFTLKNMINYKINNSELKEVESIFSWEKSNRPRTPILDFCGPVVNTYLNPNAQYYYFTTLKDYNINKMLLVINHNNIAVPVSRDLDNHKKGLLCKVLKVYDENYKYKNTLDEGVWVVEHVHIPKERYEWNGKSLLFYSKNRYMAGNDSLYRETVANEVRPLLPNLTKDKFVPEANFITLYYIPKDTIIKYMDIHIPRFNILLSRNNNLEEVRHPDFVDDEPTRLKVEFTNNTHIRYEIVKHTLPSAYEFYYVKTGNDIISITPVCSTDKEEGCYRSVINNGITVSKTYSSFENMGKEFGVYPTMDEAKYNGDVNKEFELQKQVLDKTRLEVESERIKFDFSKLELEHEKLATESEKIKLENERLKYDYEKLKLEGDKLKLDKEKLHMDMKKLEIEKQMLDIKLSLSELEYDKKKFEQHISNSKAMLDFNLYKRKIVMDIKKLSLEQDNMVYKYNHDRSMYTMKHHYDMEKISAETQALSYKSKVDSLSKATSAVNITLSTMVALIKTFN